jgi:pilus assembly protein TadC
MLNFTKPSKKKGTMGKRDPKEKSRKNPLGMPSIQKRESRLKQYLEKAGLKISPHALSKRLFNLCVFINLTISLYLVYYLSINFGFTLESTIALMVGMWVFVFIILLFIIWILFYVSLDLRISKRNRDIEEVLPDFLQLTASNIKAGMTIDQALWYAVRPRFGVLAKEIEVVAKETMGGKDLKDALQEFVAKYNSPILKKSVSLLIEGIEAGGEIGDLLIKISSNIQETKIIKQEMAANVTTYAIFISFATVIAAPVLFALSGVLIQVIQSLGSTMSNVGVATTTSGFALSFKGSGVEYGEFRIFAVVTLIITSLFSSAIIATIKKGDIKAGFKYIPMFISSSLVMYFVAQSILNKALGIFFSV